MRHSTKAGAAIETLLILAGLALLGKAFMFWSATYKLVGIADHSATGVINVVENGGFTDVVQFTDAQGRGMVFSQTGFLFGYKASQQVPILYDPENPNKAAMNDPRALWFMPTILGVPGVLLVFLGFRLRSRRNL